MAHHYHVHSQAVTMANMQSKRCEITACSGLDYALTCISVRVTPSQCEVHLPILNYV